MNKRMAKWIICGISKELDKIGKSIPSYACEVLETKLINNKYDEVITFVETMIYN